jgi:hypothetical protein
VNTKHKRYQHTIKQIKIKLTKNNLTIAKADKGKMIVIISRDQHKQKPIDIVNENEFQRLDKDPNGPLP